MEVESMKYRIHFTVGEHEDSIVLSGETVEDIQEQAARVLEERDGVDPWSELCD